MLSCHQSGSQEKEKTGVDVKNRKAKNDIVYDKAMLINIIESSDCYYGKHISSFDEESLTYRSYKCLFEMCSDSIWLEFSNSKSNVMKAYSYDALLEKNSSFAEIVKKRFLLDTSTLCFVSNDMSETISLSQYVKYKK